MKFYGFLRLIARAIMAVIGGMVCYVKRRRFNKRAALSVVIDHQQSFMTPHGTLRNTSPIPAVLTADHHPSSLSGCTVQDALASSPITMASLLAALRSPPKLLFTDAERAWLSERRNFTNFGSRRQWAHELGFIGVAYGNEAERVVGNADAFGFMVKGTNPHTDSYALLPPAVTDESSRRLDERQLGYLVHDQIDPLWPNHCIMPDAAQSAEAAAGPGKEKK